MESIIDNGLWHATTYLCYATQLTVQKGTFRAQTAVANWKCMEIPLDRIKTECDWGIMYSYYIQVFAVNVFQAEKVKVYFFKWEIEITLTIYQKVDETRGMILSFNETVVYFSLCKSVHRICITKVFRLRKGELDMIFPSEICIIVVTFSLVAIYFEPFFFYLTCLLLQKQFKNICCSSNTYTSCGNK